MTSQATFYLLPDNSHSSLSAQEQKACKLATFFWRQGKNVLLWCESEAQGERLDEALWQGSVDEFVPHNLAGELTQVPTPVEIAWTGRRNRQRRDVLINLHSQVPDFISSFHYVVDFVPPTEAEKVLARERYKHYRQLGWQLKMEDAQ